MRYTHQSLDEACVELSALAKRLGLHRIEVDVRADAMVTITAMDGRGYTAWTVRGDVLNGGSLQRPSAAICDHINDSSTPRIGDEKGDG